MKAAIGRCPPRRRWWKACRRISQSPTPTPWTVAASPIHGVFQRQATGDGSILSNDHRGQGRPALRRRQYLSLERAGERTGQAVLVGDGLRPCDARLDPRRAVFKAAPRTASVSRRTPTVRSTSTSAPGRPRARSPTGFRPAPMHNSKSSSASTGRRNRCSTRPGSCRTSNGLPVDTRKPIRFCRLARPSPLPADNFIRAESDLYFGGVVKDGGFGKFFHRREPTAMDKQTVIRMNRDTLYSAALFDLDAGSVTIRLPDAGKRFMSMQ